MPSRRLPLPALGHGAPGHGRASPVNTQPYGLPGAHTCLLHPAASSDLCRACELGYAPWAAQANSMQGRVLAFLVSVLRSEPRQLDSPRWCHTAAPLPGLAQWSQGVTRGREPRGLLGLE